jgi:hypothetical protein
MGYQFKQGNGRLFYVTLDDASVVRAVALTEGLRDKMPETESDGGKISDDERNVLVKALRRKAIMLQELAEFMEDAKELEWGH